MNCGTSPESSTAPSSNGKEGQEVTVKKIVSYLAISEFSKASLFWNYNYLGFVSPTELSFIPNDA